MGRLGCSWAELGRRMADCSKAISHAECQQSAQAQPAHPLHQQGVQPIGPQLGRDGYWYGRFPEQSTSPRTTSRPRRSRHTLEKLTPRSVGGPDYKVINALSRDIGMAEMSGHKPTRPYCLAPLFINSAYEARAWPAACRVRFSRKGAVGGSQPIRG